MAWNAIFKGYEDGIIEEDYLVHYQAWIGKAWLGPVKVFAIKGIIFVNLLMEIQGKCQDVIWNFAGTKKMWLLKIKGVRRMKK